MNAQANTLNSKIETEATRAQKDLVAQGVKVTVKFISVDNGSKSLFEGHRVCDTGRPYFHALNLSGTTVLQTSFHPNDDGIEAYGKAITAKLFS